MKISIDFFPPRRTNHAARCTQLESICVPNLLFNAAAVVGGTSALQRRATSMPVALLNKGRIFASYRLLVKSVIWRKN